MNTRDQHMYLDYSLTNLVTAMLITLTFGQLGDNNHVMPKGEGDYLAALTFDQLEDS